MRILIPVFVGFILLCSDAMSQPYNPAGIWKKSISGIYYNNGNVGIGLTSPSYLLHVSGTTYATKLLINTSFTNAVMNVGGSILTQNNGSFQTKDTGGSPIIILGLGVDNVVRVGAQQTPATNGHLLLYAGGSEKARIDPTGTFMIGTTSKPSANGSKVLVFGDNGSDPTMTAGIAGLYAKTVSTVVEMFAIGSDGLMNQISSHHPKTKELYHYSIDTKTGRHLQIDVERLAKWIDEHFGTNFVKEWYEPKPLFNELKPRDSFVRTEQ